MMIDNYLLLENDLIHMIGFPLLQEKCYIRCDADYIALSATPIPNSKCIPILLSRVLDTTELYQYFDNHSRLEFKYIQTLGCYLYGG